MKGSERNAPCPCGSGKKRKKCEPRHPPVGAELEELMDEARWEDRCRFPTAEDLELFATLRARRERRSQNLQTVIAAALAVGAPPLYRG